MARQVASIQSFFQPESRSPESPTAVYESEAVAGDGFTSTEIEAASHPTLHQWQPRTTYRDVEIGDLILGPACVAVMGRVVSFHDRMTPSKKPQAAKGCLNIIIRDDTGAFTASNPFTPR